METTIDLWANIEDNPIIDIDSYKASQWLQYPANTVSMHSYLESRGGPFKELVANAGLQVMLKKMNSQRVTRFHVEQAAMFLRLHGEPFNYEGWMRIVEHHQGRIPVRIRAVPEGTIIAPHQAMMTVESTDPQCFWVVGWLETRLMRIWYTVTVASLDREVKKDIMANLKETADAPEVVIAFKLHDFGSRGVSSQESAGLGGLAHLINFLGTDTVQALVYAKKYYNCDMAGFSIPAAEHSTITSWGKENEVEAYRNMLKQFAKPGSLVAVVSDSYNIFNAVDNLWGKELRQEVIDSGATVIIRPDSGDPVEIVSQLLQKLEAKFGSTINTKGYKVLNNVRIIQGDGCSPETIKQMLDKTKSLMFSGTNVAFGMGGALLQKVNRDTCKFAFKCSSITVYENGKYEERDVFKSPITDAVKVSKAGRLDYLKNGETVRLPDVQTGKSERFYQTAEANSAMVEVFCDGELLVEYTLDQVRERAKL